MSLTSGINHVVVETGDVDRMTQFYVDAFSAKTAFDSRDSATGSRMVIVDVGDDGRYVKIVGSPFDGARRPAVPVNVFGAERFSLAVPDLDCLRAVHQRIRDRGLSAGDIERLPTQWILNVTDPDGRTIQVSAFV